MHLSRRTRTTLSSGLLLGLLWLFSAYQSSPAPSPPVVTSPDGTPTSLPATYTPAPFQPTEDSTRSSPASAKDTREEEQVLPLELVFPTPQPDPSITWRPALYPLPWAPTPNDHFYFARPVSADLIGSPRGDYRYGGVFYEDIVHAGVDIPADPGTPVLAAGPGKVVWAGFGFSSGEKGDKSDPYGLAVFIRHDFGYQGQKLYTLYAHMDRVQVVLGQHVETGQLLGESGMTGKVSGPHLHFEVRLEQNGVFTTRNPELWLAPPQGWGVFSGRVFNSGGRRLLNQLVEVHDPNTERVWMAYSYGDGKMPADEYYQENLVISDIPAGTYTVEIKYWGKTYQLPIEILPGRVTTFSFRGNSGFVSEALENFGEDFVPSP